jgi:general stress protein 26
MTHVNLAFYKDRTREFVSVAGTAVLTGDRETIRRLWSPDWRPWFEDKGGALDGSAEDPRLFLIGVNAESAHYLELDEPQVLAAFAVARGMLTGKAPHVGEVERVSGQEMRRDRS